MNEGHTPKRKRGRPRVYGTRANFSFRITEETKKRLIDSALKAGRSLSEEVELRINRDFGWEDTKSNIEKMYAEAAATRDAAHVAAIRAAGLAILRDIDGRPTRVIVDLQTVLAEADGLARGLRSGFFQGEAPPVEPTRRMTAEEEQRLLRELDQLREQLKAAQERTAQADAAADKPDGEAA